MAELPDGGFVLSTVEEGPRKLISVDYSKLPVKALLLLSSLPVV